MPNGNNVARAEALALALGTGLLRRKVPSARAVVPPPRIILGWQLQRFLRRRAAAERERRRRRRLAAGLALVTAGALVTGARAVAKRH
jgi:hypothetical protein